MAEIGVLNLTIHDNSENAAQGLDRLTDALSRIKAAIPNNGLGLSTVAKELNAFAKQINQAKATNTVLQNIANFGKGLKDMTSAIGATSKEFDTSKITGAIDAIKASVGDGIKLGQSGTQLKNLKDALGGDWNTDNAAKAGNALNYIAEGAKSLTGTNLGTIAKNVSAVAKALDEYAAASEHMISAVSQSKSGNNAAMAELDAAAQKQREWFAAGSFTSGKRMPLNLQLFGGKGEVDGLKETEGVIQQSTETISKFKEAVSDTADPVRNIDLNRYLVSPLESLFNRATTAETAVKRVGDAMSHAMTNMSVDAMEKAIAGNAKLATTEISNLVKALNKPMKYEGLREFVDVMTGVKKGAQVGTEINEKNTMLGSVIEQQEAMQLLTARINDTASAQRKLNAAGEMYAGIIRIFDKAENRYKEIFVDTSKMAESVPAPSSVVKEEIDNSVSEQATKTGDNLGILRYREEEAAAATAKLSAEFDNLGGALRRMFPTISGLLKRFKSMAIMRGMRYLVRQISAGFSEGVQNVYQYSKLIGSDLAPSMDQAATALQQMKNSIGAAVAPAIQALVPVLQTVVNWFITLMNYANQFIALMTGQSSWVRALPESAEAFEKQKKGAKGASKAMKDLLADWDELNIIQSQNSGGSGSSGKHTEEEYRNMFETVEEFDQKIKDIVETIRDNMDTILRYAKKIGALVGAWKVSAAFKGVLGTLAGLAGTLITLDLVFEVSQKFMNKYLETGEKGWLILDLLTPMVGGLIARALLKNVMGGALANYAIPLSFAISAAADIKALIEHTDVSALSEKGLYASFTAAAKGAVAGGFLAYLIGGGLGAALAGGTAGFIGTFGIAVSLKADAEVVADGITPENIKDKLVGISALGIAGATIGAAAGGGAAGAIGMAMLFGGAAVATFGVAVGIHAINEVVDGSAITAEIVRDNFISGGLVGAGLAIVGGLLVGTAGAVAGATAGALTVGALFLIEAIIGKQPAKVKWGNYIATKKEIEAFVSEELYNNPPQVTIDLIDATIAPIDDLKTDLTTKLTTMIGTIYALSLGVLTKPKDLVEQVNAVVDSYKENNAQQQKVIDLAFNLVPTTGKKGEVTGEGTDIQNRSFERTNELNELMDQLGKDLADAYTKAYDARMNGNLDAEAEETVKKISDMMNAVANAVAVGQAKAKAGNAVQMQLQNLTKESLDELLDSYKAQQEQLVEEMLKIREDAAEGLLAQQYSYEELAKYALKEAGGDVNDKTYKEYLAKAEQAHKDYLAAIGSMQDDAEKAAENLLDPETKKKLQEAVLGFLNRDINLENFTGGYNYKNAPEESYLGGLIDLFAGDESVLQGKKAKHNIYDLLTQFIQASFTGEDKTTVKKAIDAGVVKFSDFLNEEMVDKLADTLGIEGENRKVWDNYIVELLGLDKKTPYATVIPEVEVGEPEVELSNEFIQGASKVGHAINDALEQTRQNIIIANEAIEDDATFEMPVTAVLDKDETTKAVEDAMPDSVKVNIEPVFGNKSAQEQILDALGLGNINLNNRKVLHNEDGTISTERSFSFWDEKEGKEILIPQVVDGILLSFDEAIEHYYKTGEHFGKFDTPEEADQYSTELHNRDEFFYGIKEDIESAMKDGLVDATERIGMYEEWGNFAEKLGLDKTFGYDFVDAMLEYLKTNSDGSLGNVANPARTRAFVPTVVDVGSGPRNTAESPSEPQPVEFNGETMANSVKKGTQEANTSIESLLRTVETLLRTIASKEPTVVVTPSTALGRTVGQSNRDLESVTGYYNG